MEEQLISFETAKLAKEKGYNIVTYSLQYYYAENNHNDLRDSPHNSSQVESFLVPTQSLLQTWLRKVHDLHVVVNRELLGDLMDFEPFYYDNKRWVYSIDDLRVTTQGISAMRGFSEDILPEQSIYKALEAGLQAALKLIP